MFVGIGSLTHESYNTHFQLVKACEDPAGFQLDLRERDESPEDRGKELSGEGKDYSEDEGMETEVEGDAQTFEGDDGI